MSQRYETWVVVIAIAAMAGLGCGEDSGMQGQGITGTGAGPQAVAGMMGGQPPPSTMVQPATTMTQQPAPAMTQQPATTMTQQPATTMMRQPAPTTDPTPTTPEMMTGMDPAIDPAGDADSEMEDPMPATSMCRQATSVDQDGPHTPTHIERAGPSGGSWVYHPEDMGADGMKHPVFIWGPGAGTGPSNYLDHLNRLASHGFVVISQRSSGNGSSEKAALDWLLAENEMDGSEFYQKLDTERIGMGGHSLGSLTTMSMAGDERLSMYVLVCGGCMSARGGCGAADIHGPTVILGGDGLGDTRNFEGDYEEISSPVVFLKRESTDHIQCARDNLVPWVAFMRWQHCGEEQWGEDFFDSGAYCTSPWAQCKSKNF